MDDARTTRRVDAIGRVRPRRAASCRSHHHARAVPVAEQLPTFTYFPDPVGAGSVEPAEDECASCRRARGYLYYDTFGRDERICPWCIADGSGAQWFAYNDCGLDDEFGQVSDDIIREIEERTPGFPRWQSERWLAHCRDGMEYVGEASTELLERYPGAVEAVRSALAKWGLEVAEALEPDVDAPAAYVFRCRACGIFRAFSDYH